MGDENKGCFAAVTETCDAALRAVGGSKLRAIEVLAKAIFVLSLTSSKKGCERRALLATQKIANEIFDDGIAALDKDLRRFAVGGDA